MHCKDPSADVERFSSNSCGKFSTELKNIPTFAIESKNSNNRKNAPYIRFLEHDSKLVKNDKRLTTRSAFQRSKCECSLRKTFYSRIFEFTTTSVTATYTRLNSLHHRSNEPRMKLGRLSNSCHRDGTRGNIRDALP